ncbi:N-acyl-phosphatidylethanolamine-hydrolyzing phospholipase D [Lindgomyces ingoldianus]|uniref:N-acyl-phosphatidylethanolamine-hydrolyzing phospholipase D n=1 Tax=Lindgomyces ingoldianus TaxID=673940 RepID=A0ACB6QMW3_9PLEO|nr:N-acyl-phosphatidylethanolamine-hydrolyzing phospholipase D [Lindgomyces ingoldianus]KAF2467450.1 N-acyl-phosphatidylethanolamine-hydrolyzing phospholipase D [Lindgomyces ingoldianus]
MPPLSTITPLPTRCPLNYPTPPPHHVGTPPTSFVNPWPSYNHTNVSQVIKTRWFSPKNYAPVPQDRVGLPAIRTLNFGEESAENGLKATWIGHASFLVEATKAEGKERGMRILLDPVWSERVGPYGMIGPIRFTPPPCTVDELPNVDAVCISHDHYDHLDSDTLKKLNAKQKGDLSFFCGLGVKAVLLGLEIGIKDEQVVELDWWDGVKVEKEGLESVELVCTPAQHRSGRAPWNFQRTLWCSWVVKETLTPSSRAGKSLFFAGDTGYCHVPSDDLPSHHSAPHPPCPAFSEIGTLHGPFDLALLPIGCYQPRAFMSGVHSSPEDSISIHKNVRSKKSIGMHYGTFRGSLSEHFEPVTEPPERWKSAAEKEGLVWGSEVGLCDVGETVVV